MKAVSEKIWRRMYRVDALTEQSNRCWYCRMPLTIDESTAEHVEPVARGGQTSRRNIKAACGPCNLAKGCMPAARFKRSMHAPQREDSIDIHLAHFRLRLFRRVHLAERRILKVAGVTP